MEFMEQYPDDATCLEYLWRSRYSPDGVHATCPKCGIERVQEVRDVEPEHVVDMHRVLVARLGYGRDDLPQVVHVASPVVLRDVPDDQHSLRDLRQAVGA